MQDVSVFGGAVLNEFQPTSIKKMKHHKLKSSKVAKDNLTLCACSIKTMMLRTFVNMLGQEETHHIKNQGQSPFYSLQV
jgi:hypothetical protein